MVYRETLSIQRRLLQHLVRKSSIHGWPGEWGPQSMPITGGGGLARVPWYMQGRKDELTSWRGTVQSAWQKPPVRRKGGRAGLHKKGKWSPRSGRDQSMESNVSEHTSPPLMSERQTPDTTLDPRCQSGPSARNSFNPSQGRCSKNEGADQQRL